MTPSAETLALRLLSLLEGVEGSYTCLCSRRLKVGLSSELWETAVRLKAALGDSAPLAGEETSRFALIEVE